MKKILKAFVMAFSMFTAIPVPFNIWDEEARPLMTLCLPLVGLILGALFGALASLLRILQIPALVSAAVLTAFMPLITGFMHLDGFMDVTDAVKSWRDLEERRRILKDSRVGAFAVIALVLYMILTFAVFSGCDTRVNLWPLVFIPMGTRSMAALAVTALKPISESEYAGTYRKNVKKGHLAVCIIFVCVSLTLPLILAKWQGLSVSAACLGYGLALRRAYKSLQGMSGDISGYALCCGELCGIAALLLLALYIV